MDEATTPAAGPSAPPRPPTGVRTDEALIRLALAGDAAAFATLLGRYDRGVHTLARRLLASEYDADDAVQETFVRVYTRLHTYAPTGRFGSWVLAICAHHCLDVLRARRRRVATVALAGQPDDARFSSGEAGPEEHALRAATRAEVRGWLAALPAEYRAVLALRYERDYSYAEIATTLGLPLSTVRMRLRRARAALRARATWACPAVAPRREKG